jgi:8-oxo-dGTP diphosphatase
LAKRQAGGALSLRWEFPGGKCREKEDLAGCLEREFQEELEVTITVGETLGSVPFRHKGTHFDLVALEVLMDSDPKVLHVHEECGWFTEEEMLNLDLADSDRLLYEQFRSRFREVLRRSLER